MEVIKKTIQQALTTTPVIPCGDDVVGPCRRIIPDLNAVYFLKLSLTSEVMDIGFFDAYVEPPEPPVPPTTTFYLVDNSNNIFTDDNNDKFIYQ